MIKDLEVELTNICNLKCPLCIRNTKTFKSLKLKKEFLDKNILFDILDKNKVQSLVFAGSIAEPTLHPEFLDIITYILKKYDIKITLYSNGTSNELLYKKIALLFASKLKGINKIIFTVAGSTQELHEKYRVGSNLADIIKKYDICSKYCYTELNWLIFNYNYEDYTNNKNFLGSRVHRVFYSIAYKELLNGEYDSNIQLPDELVKKIQDIDKEWDGNCPAESANFRSLGYDGNLYKCNMKRYYGDKFCYICSKKNLEKLLQNKVTPPPEPSGEVFIYDSPGVIK